MKYHKNGDHGEGELNGNTIHSIPQKKSRANQLKNWCFTWNNYDKSAIPKLMERLESISLKFVFQEETGENGTPHLQGFIQLKKAMRWTEFNLTTAIHWEKCRNVEASIKYCQKIETRTGDVFKYGFPKEVKTISKLFEWQKYIVDYINGPINDREVLWIYDPIGNNGKTQLCKYLNVHYKAIIATGGGNKDIANLLWNLHENGTDLNDKTTFLFSFGRSTEGISYKAIESVKDGLITNTKYEAGTLVFNSPHVIILSNDLPDQSKLSSDRWIIKQLNNGILSDFVDSDVDSVIANP